MNKLLVLTFAAVAAGLAGCAPAPPTTTAVPITAPPAVSKSAVAQGVLLSVEYELAGGRTGGFTRLNDAKAVPGGNGSWSVDAYGQLTPEFLIITYPQQKDMGPQVIPVHRLVSVQFGDGGIKEVPPAAPSAAR